MRGFEGSEVEVALNVSALAAPLEIVDRYAVCCSDAERLAGAARCFAVGGPAQHEFRRAIERWAEHLEDIAGVQGLDEKRERLAKAEWCAAAISRALPQISGPNVPA